MGRETGERAPQRKVHQTVPVCGQARCPRAAVDARGGAVSGGEADRELANGV